MGQIANPVKVTEEGLLVVRSVRSYKECEKYGRSYEWTITLYLYGSDKKQTQKFFGLSDQKYFHWLKLLAKKSSQNRNKTRNEKEDNKEQFSVI